MSAHALAVVLTVDVLVAGQYRAHGVCACGQWDDLHVTSGEPANIASSIARRWDAHAREATR